MFGGSFIFPPQSNSDHGPPIANLCYRHTLLHNYGIAYGLPKDHDTHNLFLALNRQTFYKKLYL